MPFLWLKRIEILTGYSSFLDNISLPKIEFAYIDGAHFYEGVRHDFYSFLKIAAPHFVVLFDDYVKREQYGVTKLIDEDVALNFDVTNIRVNMDYLRKTHITDDPHAGMILIESTSIKKPLEGVYPQDKIDRILLNYRSFEKRLRLREKLNEKFPFLKKIRFSKYLPRV